MMTDEVTAADVLAATKSVSELLGLLSQVMAKRSEYDPILEALDSDIADIRAAIATNMIGSGAERFRGSGKVAVIQERKSVTVVDPQAAMTWLEERDMLARYMRLDTSLLTKEQKDVPGIRIDRKPTLAISDDTKGAR